MSLVSSGRLRRAWFIDTSALCALADRRESDAAVAVAILRRAQTQRIPLVTTNYVVAESHAMVLRRMGRTVALTFLERLSGTVPNQEWVTAKDVDLAVNVIRQYADQSFSLTDATSFMVMERLGISTAFAFDRDFLRYGFEQAQPS